jgi:hypothetical protein
MVSFLGTRLLPLVRNFFPSDSKEGLGNIVDVSEHCCHALTYKVLTDDTGHVIYHSLLRPANADDVNLCASMFAGEPDTHNKVVKSRNDFSQPCHMDDESKLAATTSPSPVFIPQDLLGRSFLMDKQSDGRKPRATITQLLEDHESSL